MLMLRACRVIQEIMSSFPEAGIAGSVERMASFMRFLGCIRVHAVTMSWLEFQLWLLQFVLEVALA